MRRSTSASAISQTDRRSGSVIMTSLGRARRHRLPLRRRGARASCALQPSLRPVLLVGRRFAARAGRPQKISQPPRMPTRPPIPTRQLDESSRGSSPSVVEASCWRPCQPARWARLVGAADSWVPPHPIDLCHRPDQHCAGYAFCWSRRRRRMPPRTAPSIPRPVMTAALGQSGLVAGAGTMWKKTDVSSSQ
jgi:hypothetical protein